MGKFSAGVVLSAILSVAIGLVGPGRNADVAEHFLGKVTSAEVQVSEGKPSTIVCCEKSRIVIRGDVDIPTGRLAKLVITRGRLWDTCELEVDGKVFPVRGTY